MDTAQILSFLGSKAPNGSLLTSIKAGLSPRTIATLAERIGVPQTVLLQKLTISESTHARRTKSRQKLTMQESDRLIWVARVYAYATEVFSSEEKARQWMQHPIRALHFTAPFDYLDTEEGARQIEAILTRLEHGVFS